jgi:integrase
MPKRATPLTAAKVKTAKAGRTKAGRPAKARRYGDGDGLYLLVRADGAAFWLFRYVLSGKKMRELGLGRARGPKAVTLAAARAAAAALHGLVRNGIDPLDQRKADRAQRAAAAQAEQANAITFRAVARFYMDAHEAGWGNSKHRQQWQNTLDTYVMPHMGEIAVGTVDSGAVMRVLEPIWHSKPETASRVRGRIESVLDFAAARAWRSGDNAARWKGHLSNLLPARAKLAPVEHHASLPWSAIGGFMATLQGVQSIAAKALRFAVLTAARSGEARGATWGEMDLADAIWTIPATRMKSGQQHRVPLSEAALAVLREAAKLRQNDGPAALVFPGASGAKPLSDMALARLVPSGATVHGFRSCFRTWAGETTSYPREVIEMALAHRLGDAVGQGYARGDLFQRRKSLMEAWAAFIAGPVVATGTVVPMRATA